MCTHSWGFPQLDLCEQVDLVRFLRTSPLLQNASSVQQFNKKQEECRELFIGENEQPLQKGMAQHRWASSSFQDSAVHLQCIERKHGARLRRTKHLDQPWKMASLRGCQTDHSCQMGKNIFEQRWMKTRFWTEVDDWDILYPNAVLNSFHQWSKHSHIFTRSGDSSSCDSGSNGGAPTSETWPTTLLTTLGLLSRSLTC